MINMQKNSDIQPLVSVMIPVYNGEKEIPLSLESLFNQTYTNWECIMVDDGSTDKTLKVVKKFKDDRIKLFSFKENKGRPYARQKALEEASGKYIAMLDADDWYYPEKLAVQVAYMETHENCVLFSSGMAITEKNNELDVIQCAGNKEILTYHFSNPINYKVVPHAPSMMRTENAKKVKYDLSLHVGQDQDFMIRLLKDQDYALYQEVLYVYNLGGSLTLKKYISGQKATIKLWTKQLQDNQSALFKKKIAAHLKILLGIGLKTVGYFSFLSSRRGTKPTEEQAQIFYKNRAKLESRS